LKKPTPISSSRISWFFFSPGAGGVPRRNSGDGNKCLRPIEDSGFDEVDPSFQVVKYFFLVLKISQRISLKQRETAVPAWKKPGSKDPGFCCYALLDVNGWLRSEQP
jgi:hypothetical protein